MRNSIITDTVFSHPLTTKFGTIEVVTCDTGVGGVVFIRRLHTGEMVFLTYRRLMRIIEASRMFPSSVLASKDPRIQHQYHVGGRMYLTVKDPHFGMRLGDFALQHGYLTPQEPEIRLSIDDWKGFETFLNSHEVSAELQTVQTCVESGDHFTAICGADGYCAECCVYVTLP